jgi:hypothetical protein
MRKPRHRGIDLVALLACSLLAAFPGSILHAADPGSESTAQIFKTFLERLAMDRSAAEKEKAAILEHIAKAESFLSGLTLPKDAAADAKARQAIAKDRDALNKVDQRLRLEEQATRSEKLAIPRGLRGTVNKRTAAGWEPMSENTPFLPGDEIRTSSDGQVTLLFDDGSRIELERNSQFRYLPPATGKQLSETVYELIMGVIRVKVRSTPDAVRGEVRVKTRTAVAAVRGTEFRLCVDDRGMTHLVPFTGTVELTADAAKIDRSALDRWWQPEADVPPHAPLPQGRFLRVVNVRGNPRVQAADGSSREAKAGDLLTIGNRLDAGGGGFALVDLSRGYRAALGADTQIEIKPSDVPGKPIYAILAGRLHAEETSTGAATADDEPPFATPNETVDVLGAAFDVGLSQTQESDFVVFAGSLIVSERKTGDK